MQLTVQITKITDNTEEFFKYTKNSKSKGFQRFLVNKELRNKSLYKQFLKALDEDAPDYIDSDPSRIYPESPSLRLHGKTLRQTFNERDNFEVGLLNDTVVVEFQIDHPTYNNSDTGIVEWLIDGTRPHLIPKSESFVAFYWGSPLRWKPDNGVAGWRTNQIRNNGVLVNQSEYFGQSTFGRGYWAAGMPDFVQSTLQKTDKSWKNTYHNITLDLMDSAIARGRYTELKKR